MMVYPALAKTSSIPPIILVTLLHILVSLSFFWDEVTTILQNKILWCLQAGVDSRLWYESAACTQQKWSAAVQDSAAIWNWNRGTGATHFSHHSKTTNSWQRKAQSTSCAASPSISEAVAFILPVTLYGKGKTVQKISEPGRASLDIIITRVNYMCIWMKLGHNTAVFRQPKFYMLQSDKTNTWLFNNISEWEIDVMKYTRLPLGDMCALNTHRKKGVKHLPAWLPEKTFLIPNTINLVLRMWSGKASWIR